MKFLSVIAAALVGAVLSQVATSAQAATLINENFGSGSPDRLDVSTGNISPAFVVTSGNVDLIGNGGAFDLYAGNGNYIDLNGSTSGTISSVDSFNFSAADTTTLSFDYGTNGVGTSADVFLGTTKLLSIVGNGSPTFTRVNFSLVGATSGNLIFASTNPGGGGIVLDNVALNSTLPAEAVPEPLTIIGTVIGGLAAVRAKQKLVATQK